MILEYYRQILILSIVLLVFGCVVPFLMALQLVESTFFLNFLSFGASVLGLFLGLAGVAGMRVVNKRKEENRDR